MKSEKYLKRRQFSWDKQGLSTMKNLETVVEERLTNDYCFKNVTRQNYLMSWYKSIQVKNKLKDWENIHLKRTNLSSIEKSPRNQ